MSCKSPSTCKRVRSSSTFLQQFSPNLCVGPNWNLQHKPPFRPEERDRSGFVLLEYVRGRRSGPLSRPLDHVEARSGAVRQVV
jgi:hypothetical protein